MRGLFLSVSLGWAGQAHACDVALMLAVDVSGSVDPEEYRIQMDGLAAALVDPQIADALITSEAQVALMQWTGTGRQRVVINWTKMDSDAAVTEFALSVASSPRVWRNFSTAIGEALALSLDYFELVPDCRKFIVDVSGDGPSNEGRPPQELWPALNAAGVTVNALVIEESVGGLTGYFETDVITGDGAFTVTANTFEDYPDEIARKLFRELTKAFAGLSAE